MQNGIITCSDLYVYPRDASASRQVLVLYCEESIRSATK